LWPELLARPVLRDVLGPRARATEPVRAWPIPTRYDPARLGNGRVLFVGDAAGVVDPMTGEGIAQALETGLLAAEAIAAGGHPDAVAARYRRSVGRRLGRDLRFASALQTVLRHPLGARAAIAAAGLTPWTRRNFARWMFEDYPRAQILTPDRWRRGALSAPGAYAMP
jgi:flavin-dependent dehydrogenase